MLVLVTLLAGCTGERRAPAIPDLDVPTLEVDLEVVDTTIEPGRCFDHATEFGQECHVVRLRFSNPNDATVKTKLSWSAADVSGAGVDFGDMQGPESVVAGGEQSLSVRFTTDEGAPHLSRIVFDGFPRAHGEADIPAY